MEYIEEEPNFYLIQLKQKWTVVQFLLVGEESLYSKIWMKDVQTMICLPETVNKTLNLARTICAS